MKAILKLKQLVLSSNVRDFVLLALVSAFLRSQWKFEYRFWLPSCLGHCWPNLPDASTVHLILYLLPNNEILVVPVEDFLFSLRELVEHQGHQGTIVLLLRPFSYCSSFVMLRFLMHFGRAQRCIKEEQERRKKKREEMKLFWPSSGHSQKHCLL